VIAVRAATSAACGPNEVAAGQRGFILVRGQDEPIMLGHFLEPRVVESMRRQGLAAPEPGSPGWPRYQRQLSAGGPGAKAMAFQRESRELVQRFVSDPNFAGMALKLEAEPYAIVLFTGDAEARLRQYTSDPRFRAKQAALSRAQLRALQDRIGKELMGLGIHWTASWSDEENNQAVVSVTEWDKLQAAMAEGRLRVPPQVLFKPNHGAIASAPQRAGSVVHFPQFKYPGRLMDARLAGLLEVRNGCLYVGDTLILWPSNARLDLGADGVLLVHGGRWERPLRVGEQVEMGGGEPWTNFVGEGLLEQLPTACAGRLWIAS
jgi:hypothetical protein